jgi:hypothetical protein
MSPPEAEPAGAARLAEIADELEAAGVDVEHLRALGHQVEAIEVPPGLFGKLSHKARQAAAKQWRNFVGELQESREAMALITARLSGERELAPDEVDKIRAQMLDLVRVFPAGLIAAANSAFPVPGTGLFTPWILSRLGLMPSRWREAHVLEELRRQQELLRRTGHAAAATELEQLRENLEHEADQRAIASRDARVLTHWDANANGVWDPEERAAYADEVTKIRAAISKFAARKRWFLEYEGEVFGPTRLSSVDLDVAGSMLVCFDGKTGWVALDDVLDP